MFCCEARESDNETGFSKCALTVEVHVQDCVSEMKGETVDKKYNKQLRHSVNLGH